MKPIIKNNRGFWIAFAVYCLMLIADIGFTLAVSHYQHLETNPVYLLTGSLWPIVLINFVVIFVFLWLYLHEKARPLTRFLTLNYMVVIILARALAIKNAIKYLNAPLTLAEAQAVTTAMKVQTTIAFSIIIFALLSQAIVTFLLWQMDHKTKKK